MPEYYQIAWKQVGVLPFRGKKKKTMELNLERNLGKYFSKTMYHSHAQKFSTAGLLLAE